VKKPTAFNFIEKNIAIRLKYSNEHNNVRKIAVYFVPTYTHSYTP